MNEPKSISELFIFKSLIQFRIFAKFLLLLIAPKYKPASIPLIDWLTLFYRYINAAMHNFIHISKVSEKLHGFFAVIWMQQFTFLNYLLFLFSRFALPERMKTLITTDSFNADDGKLGSSGENWLDLQLYGTTVCKRRQHPFQSIE